MIKLFTPNDSKPWSEPKFAVACSGGYDSMAAAHFFVKGKRKPIILHVNHGTGNDAAENLVEDFCESNDLKFFRYQVDPNKKPKKDSWEEYWRNQRMGAFNSIKIPVITGHNLDDAMETWLFSSIHGQSKLIPYNTNNVYRPFLLTHKQTLYNYAVKHDISWVEDESNKDVKFVRNRIRHNILPEVMQINAGFATVIKRKYRETYETFKN